MLTKQLTYKCATDKLTTIIFDTFCNLAVIRIAKIKSKLPFEFE